jgi:hypothetical protein
MRSRPIDKNNLKLGWEIFEIEVEIARQSVTIKTMLEGKCYKANKFTTTCAISAYHH